MKLTPNPRFARRYGGSRLALSGIDRLGEREPGYRFKYGWSTTAAAWTITATRIEDGAFAGYVEAE